MSKTKTGLKRDTIDKFYTKPAISQECIDIVYRYFELSNSIVIEPSAGDGSFSNILSKNKEFELRSYDLSPQNENITKIDFLSDEMENILKEFNKAIHFIGNPPFGRQSTLAKKFIKRCCKYGDSISFILPKSFKKTSMNNSFNKYFHLEISRDLKENSFLIDGEEVNVPCVFQIWIKKETPREFEEKYIPINFKYVKINENPDFAIRRVGVYAGAIFSKNLDKKSFQSHNFIKINNNIDKSKFIKLYNQVEYVNKNDTVGPKSISKNSITKEINKILQYRSLDDKTHTELRNLCIENNIDTSPVKSEPSYHLNYATKEKLKERLYNLIL